MLLTRYDPPDQITDGPYRPSDSLSLRFDQRCKSRFAAVTTTQQSKVTVVLPRGLVLRNGGRLSNKDGDCLEVLAAHETLYRVTAKNPHDLLRATYHLGNRHVRLEVKPNFLQLEPDPVLLEMLHQLGGVEVKTVEAIFEPETGAYGGGHHHGHDETYSEDYAAAQAVFHYHHG
ncbi:MAG: urease accessory protein UreE [Caldilineaceae bacterium]|nr:urease accessory protein UreE [Caldilineaceae bacterium]